jgi:hypothetical protein
VNVAGRRLGMVNDGHTAKLVEMQPAGDGSEYGACMLVVQSSLRNQSIPRRAQRCGARRHLVNLVAQLVALPPSLTAV